MIREKIISGRGREGVTDNAGVDLRTFVSGACGATGFRTGTATFLPMTNLPYNFHRFREAVSVLAGSARVVIEGRAYRLQPHDCVHVPAGFAHLVENDDPARLLV